ncbi:MAG: hypothetical protein Q9191_007052, partial [Dirinaria sp. TL-2023a]
MDNSSQIQPPPPPMSYVLEQLIPLFEAKLNGDIDTSNLKSFGCWPNVTEINTAIETKMDEVRGTEEFRVLQAGGHDEPFMWRWWKLEDLWKNWGSWGEGEYP